MSVPITRTEWDAKLKHAHDQAHRATKAEFARNYSEAFQLYVRAGQLFVWLLGNIPSQPQGSGSSSRHAVGITDSQGGASSSVLIGGDGYSSAAAAQTRERLKQMANKVMARAEKIKSTRNDLRPVERDALSQEEQARILATSSLINGDRYAEWNQATVQQSVECGVTSLQEAQPALSPEQVRKGAIYKRLSRSASADAHGWGKRLRGSEIVQDIVTDCSFVAALEAAAEHDHLFGGQLATSALYPQDGQGRIQRSSNGLYHVKLHINGTPRVVVIDDQLPYYPRAPCQQTDDGIDGTDEAPLMCATSRTGQATWPALLEKAYLKVMGGYDFAGSNGCTDLYTLTGWLPEHIFLRHAGFQREKTWSRFHAAWRAGRCMATAGTGRAPSHGPDIVAATTGQAQTQDPLATFLPESGLVSSHNYAILDVREHGSRRYVRLMNPWRSAADIRPAIAISALEEQRIYATSTAHSPDSLEAQLAALQLQPGAAAQRDASSPTFVVTWDDLCNHFDSLFLNWDPSLFDHRVTVHSSWRDSCPPPDAASSVGYRPHDPHFKLVVSLPRRMAASVETAGTDPAVEVWLLLTRHITNTQHLSGGLNQGTTHGSADFIALHVFEDDQQAAANAPSASVSAVHLRKAKHMGAYVDGTHCLVRLKPSVLRQRASLQTGSSSPGQQSVQPLQCSFTVVVSRRDERGALHASDSGDGSSGDESTAARREVNYTLSVHSRYAMELSELRTRLPFRAAVRGCWSARTAGGNASLASFLVNPQYSVCIAAGAGEVQMQVVLESADRTLPVQVLLAYPGSGSGRVTHLSEGDVVLSSGMYHHGLALCSTSLPGVRLKAGTYTLVVSTFEAAMLGEFHLSVECCRRVQLLPIPQEGAGMFHRRLAGAWHRGTGGPSTSAQYFANPSWRFHIHHPAPSTTMLARLQVQPPTTPATSDAVRPYVHLALYRETEHGDTETQVATSGAYTDWPCGAALDQVQLAPGSYRLIASTYRPNTDARFVIDLYTALKVDPVAI